MDPNACWRRWQHAVAANEHEEAREAWQDLAAWIRMGGFEPGWTESQKHAFRCWMPAERVS